MNILKAVVIGMAVLIVLGTGLLVYGLVERSVNGEATQALPPPAEPPATFGVVALPLAEGCTIADMAVEHGRLYVRTEPAGSCARIYVLDAASGTVLGSVEAEP